MYEYELTHCVYLHTTQQQQQQLLMHNQL